MSAFFRLVSVLVLLSSFLRSAELTKDEESSLLTQLRERRAEYPALTADFTEDRVTRLVTKPIHSTGAIAFHTPNQFRRELKGTSPSITVCNGSELWIYYPNFKEAEHYTLGQKQFFDDSLAALTAGLNFQDVDRYFRVAPSRDGSGYRIVLTPKSAGLRRLLTSLVVSINSDLLIEKTEALLPKGDRVTTTYKNVRPAKSVSASFDFKPPADAHISSPLGK